MKKAELIAILTTTITNAVNDGIGTARAELRQGSRVDSAACSLAERRIRWCTGTTIEKAQATAAAYAAYTRRCAAVATAIAGTISVLAVVTAIAAILTGAVWLAALPAAVAAMPIWGTIRCLKEATTDAILAEVAANAHEEGRRLVYMAADSIKEENGWE